MRTDEVSQYRIDLTVLVRAKSREDAKEMGRGLVSRLKTRQLVTRGAIVADVDVIDVRAV